MPKRSNEEERIQSAPSAPGWKGGDSLNLVYRLNERSLQALSDLAASSSPCGLPAIEHHRELWSTLSADALKRAARVPFVVLDVQFRSEQWWRRVINPIDQLSDVGVPAIVGLPARIADPLMQETLIFAWHTVKWDQRVARLSLGMSPAVADLIGAVTPQELAAISGLHSRELRLRWQCQPDFWSDLLRAAKSDDQQVLADVHLHAKLRLCGELI